MARRKIEWVWKVSDSKGVERIYARIGTGKQALMKFIGFSGLPSAEEFLKAFKAGAHLYQADADAASHAAYVEQGIHFRQGPKEWSPRYPGWLRRERIT